MARQLGIPYYLLNHEREFDRTVIDDFAREYRAGRTPSPCVVCNREVKFGTLLRRALAWEARAVATGHYARVSRDPGTGRFLLWRSRDPRKDQSYFLWPLTQDQLAAARFPIGELTKDEVRAKARGLGLATAEKPESQEICFIPDDDYRGFLKRRIPEAFRPGIIEDREGRPLGTHQGIAAYTVGQRRGLGLQASRPLYVLALDPERNAVVVGGEEELETREIAAEQVNFIAFDRLEGDLRVAAKIRRSHAPAAATLRGIPRGVLVSFDVAQRAVTPGQSVVFYQDELVVGGGIIAGA